MSEINPHVVFVCAYHLEATALINFYKLKRDVSISNFAYYRREQIALLETGPGKINAACSTAYIAGILNLYNTAWINIGVAGHRTLAVGDSVLCNKITDNDTAQNYYPDMSHKGSLATYALTTVNTPENNYPKDSLYDMEAAGFFHSVSRFSTIEHIQCFKIISDNLTVPVTDFDAKNTVSLVQNRLENITTLCNSLCNSISAYRSHYPEHHEYDIYIQQLHFTQTQRAQLKILLRRWHVFNTSPLLETFSPELYNQSKLLLRDISNHVHQISISTNSDLATQDD